RVLSDLIGALGSRDRARDGVEHLDPAKRECGHAHGRWYQRSQPFDDGEPLVEVEAGESLAAIERLAVRIERSMVALLELLVLRHLAAEHPRRERKPREDADLAAPSLA